MCETSGKEDNKFEDKECTKEVAEDVTKYNKSKAWEPGADKKVIEDEKSIEDGSKHTESKTGESEATKSVEDTEHSTMRNEERTHIPDG